MDSQPLTLGAWIGRVQRLQGGAPGIAVVVATLLATAYFAFQPELFFSTGRYPKLVLMLPGFLIGLLVFFAASILTWLVRRASDRRAP